jgi:hypothetical protein
MNPTWTWRLLVLTAISSALLCVVSVSRVVTRLSHVATLRHQTVALVEKNEASALVLEHTLPQVAGAIRAAQGKLRDKATRLEAAVEATHKRLSDAIARRKHEVEAAHEKQQQKQGGAAPHSGDATATEPLIFGHGGAHVLEGSQNRMALEQRWGYEIGSNELQLHRQLLGQVAVAARTLESQCALAAWREYLDRMIEWMEARDDTMLYNWI